MKESVTNEYIAPHTGEDILTILSILVGPRSEGYIKLRSTNPSDPPIIDPQVFSHPDDMRAMIESLKVIRKIMNTTVIQEKLGAVPFPGNTLPGCKNFSPDSDQFRECQIRTFTYLEFHCCCTAKMGTSDDKFAVTDPYLRVYKVKNLRIVDTSVWPKVVTGNTMAPTIAVAERAADIIIKGQVLAKCLPPYENQEKILSTYTKLP